LLRQSWQGDDEDVVVLMRALHSAGARAAELPQSDGLAAVFAAVDDVLPTLDGSEPYDGPLLKFVARTALAPRTLRRDHHEPLRAAGFSAREIHDAVNVACCFSYMNRLADGLGVTLLPDREQWALRLFGPEAWQKHQAWGLPTREQP
jgi:hypothetical protein